MWGKCCPLTPDMDGYLSVEWGLWPWPQQRDSSPGSILSKVFGVTLR